jgi:hypothetical protein
MSAANCTLRDWIAPSLRVKHDDRRLAAGRQDALQGVHEVDPPGAGEVLEEVRAVRSLHAAVGESPRRRGLVEHEVGLGRGDQADPEEAGLLRTAAGEVEP